MIFGQKKWLITIMTIIVSIFFIVTTYYFTSGNLYTTSLWPMSGIAIGLFMGYRKKVLPGLIIGLLLGRIIARVLQVDEHFLISLGLSVINTIATMVAVFVFYYIMKETKALGKITTYSFLSYLGAILFASITAAFIATPGIILVTDESYLVIFIQWVIGDFFGTLIFGTILLLSFYYEEKWKTTPTDLVLSGIIIMLFTGFTILIFDSPIPGFGYDNYYMLFVIFFLILGFYFSFKMILLFSTIYFFSYQFLHLHALDMHLQQHVVELNLTLLVFMLMACSIKIILHNIKQQNKELIDTKKKVDLLLDSTYRIFRFSDVVLQDSKIKVNEYLKEMFQIATSIFDNFDKASVYLKGENYVQFVDAYGFDINQLNEYKFVVDSFRWNLDMPKIKRNADEDIRETLGKDYADYVEENSTVKESIYFTIYVEKQLVGGMSFDIAKGSSRSFTSQDVEQFRVFQQLMNSFFSISMITREKDTLRNDLIISLVRTLELYDHYTGGHSEDVANLAHAIAKQMKLKKEEISDIYWGGIVHDIGKVGIDADIINKPGKLSLEEYEQIKDHPNFGYQILSKSEELTNIAKLVKYHHEWWNGSGYPDQIKEEEIPLGAQILGVCDAVSSMATKRPYTTKKTSKQIKDELLLYKGTQFSPLIVDEMVRFIDSGDLDRYYETHAKERK